MAVHRKKNHLHPEIQLYTRENVCGCGIFRNGADILCISYKVAKPYLTTQL